MYKFQILCLGKPRTTQLEASTCLIHPLVFEEISIEKQLGTDCIRINGTLYQTPVNEINCVQLDNYTFVSFGYFLPDELDE